MLTTGRFVAQWSMTPSKAVLVTSAQVLLCPFVTETRAAPSKAVRPEACAKLQEALPDGQIPVGCLWDRADPLSVPRCRVSALAVAGVFYLLAFLNCFAVGARDAHVRSAFVPRVRRVGL